MRGLYTPLNSTHLNIPAAHTSKVPLTKRQLHHWSKLSQLDYLISIQEVTIATTVTKPLELRAFLQRLVTRLCFLPSYSACSVMTRCHSPSRHETESKLFVCARVHTCVRMCMPSVCSHMLTCPCACAYLYAPGVSLRMCVFVHGVCFCVCAQIYS